jgi:hypothetical protein
MGRCRSTQSAAGLDAPTINGHATEVIALSATATVAPLPAARAKRIENVPICAIANPDLTAVLGRSPTATEANETLMTLPHDRHCSKHHQRRPVHCQQTRVDAHPDPNEEDRAK